MEFPKLKKRFKGLLSSVGRVVDTSKKIALGAGIQGATIFAYLTSDYNAGNRGTIQGRSVTTAGGTWLSPIYLAPGFSYTIVFFLPGAFGPDSRVIMV